MRDSMAPLIAELRVLTDTVDTSDNAQIDFGVWSDDYLQSVMDINARTELVDVALIPVRDIEGSYTRYTIPVARNTWVEDGAVVVDGLGDAAIGYTLDLNTRTVTFEEDTAGKSYYIRGTAFNLYEAAAEVWFRKAGLRASMISVKAGDHTLREDQEYAHCMERYRFFRGARVTHIRLRKNEYAAY